MTLTNTTQKKDLSRGIDMLPEILVCPKRGGVSPVGYRRIDVTSHSQEVFRSCSPFFAGPVVLYGGYTARNVENAWQYSKVYSRFLDEHGDPSPAYFEWAKKGWDDAVAHRHPLGRIAPKYSWWEGRKLDYIEARKQIYIPLYSKAVVKTEGFQELQRLYAAGESICLLDYDAYDFKAFGYSPEDAINDPEHAMGHCFILKFLLEGTLPIPRAFKVIIAGGRDFSDYDMLCRYADACLRNKAVDGIEVVCGKARGADSLGEQYAKDRRYAIRYFPADWEHLGKSAGFIRNDQMAAYADALIAFWDGASHGTKHMIDTATKRKLAVRVKYYRTNIEGRQNHE